MRTIFKAVTRKRVFCTIGLPWGLMALTIIDFNFTKYINWSINLQELYNDNPALVIILFVFLTIIFIGLILIKIILIITDRVLIIQDGMDGKILPVSKLSELYDSKTLRVNLEKQTKKNIDNGFNLMLEEFNNINSENGKYLYCGVSYIPFVYKLGALFSDQGIDVCFCQISRKKEKTKLIKFKNRSKKPFTDINSQYVEKGNSDDLLVTIGLSFEIDEKMDEKFQNMSRLTFTTSVPSRELLMSNSDIKNAVDYVVKEIRKYQNNYERVHLFISASTAFIFRLGMEYSKKTYDKSMIVYHYESINKHNRPWGIEINSSKSSSVIINN